MRRHGDLGEQTSERANADSFRGRLIDAIHRGLLQPDEASSVHAAIRIFEDHFLGEVAGLGFAAAEARVEYYDDLQRQCEQAGELLERLSATPSRKVAELLAAQPCAALAVEAGGRIVLANPAAQALPELHELPNVLALHFDPRGMAELAAFLKTCRTSAGPGRPLVVNAWSKDTDAAIILVLERLSVDFPDFADVVAASGPVIVAKTTIAAFDETIWSTISAAYGLTEAEAAVMRLLVEGCSLEETARRRGRSLNTVKSQAKGVLAKTGTGKQMELVRLVTTLAHLAGAGGPPARDTTADAPGGHSELWLPEGRPQKYVEVGRPDGRSVLFLQPTARPDFTADLRREFATAGLRMISPVRPGSWGMPRATSSWGPEDAARDYRALADKLGLMPGVVVGYRAGAPQALHLASLCPGGFRRVILIDTGAPLDRMAKIEKMPAWPRLLFTGVRFAPQFAALMYRFGGVNMKRRRNDEEYWARFYFRGNPVDDGLLRDARFRRIAAGTVRYTMEDSDQLVRELSAWSQDWTALADKVLATTEIRFVHGADNLWFPSADVEAFCSTRGRASCKIVRGAGNFLLHSHGTLIAREIARAFD